MPVSGYSIVTPHYKNVKSFFCHQASPFSPLIILWSSNKERGLANPMHWMSSQGLDRTSSGPRLDSHVPHCPFFLVLSVCEALGLGWTILNHTFTSQQSECLVLWEQLKNLSLKGGRALWEYWEYLTGLNSGFIDIFQYINRWILLFRVDKLLKNCLWDEFTKLSTEFHYKLGAVVPWGKLGSHD